MSTESMARVVIVPILLVVIGVPDNARARSRIPVASAPIENAQNLIRSDEKRVSSIIVNERPRRKTALNRRLHSIT
jgi:hypothetical protein